MTIGVVVFVRLDSHRLPGKALADLGGRPVLGRLIDRLRRLPVSLPLVLATSDRSVDDPLAAFARRERLPIFRGAAEDVAHRLLAAIDAFGWSAAVRISGDSPFMDPGLIVSLVTHHHRHRPDLTTNVFPRSLPPGLSVEVIERSTLARVLRETDDPAAREHVTTHIYQNASHYRVDNVDCCNGGPGADGRLVVDTPEDLARARWMVEQIGAAPECADRNDCIALAQAWHPTVATEAAPEVIVA